MQPIRDLLPSVMRDLQNPQLLNRGTLIDRWSAIAGSKIAPHTRPSLKNNGELYVWVDQPALAFELNQRYRPTLLKRVQAVLGEDAVKSVRIRVGQLR